MQNFGVSQSGTRVGLLVFSSNAVVMVRLSDLRDYDSFIRAIDSIAFPGGISRIDKALKVAGSGLFGLGARSDVPKLLILLSDGIQSRGSGSLTPSFLAGQLKNTGILIYAVAVGGTADVGRLIKIAGDKNRVVLAESYDQLNSDGIVRMVTDVSCKTAGNFSEFLWYSYILILGQSLDI